MFPSIRDLQRHKCLSSSHATCCASMAVNTCFYSTSATTTLIWHAGAPYHGAQLIFMPSFRCPPDWDTIIIRKPLISSSKMSKTGKNFYNFFFIRYNSKIRYILKVKILNEIYTYLVFLIVKFEPIICNISKFIACWSLYTSAHEYLMHFPVKTSSSGLKRSGWTQILKSNIYTHVGTGFSIYLLQWNSIS